MIQLHKITWLGGIIGFLVVVLSIIKWFFMTTYLSKLAFGLGIGFTIICFAYIHECLKMHDKHKRNMNHRLDELEFWAREKGFDK